MFSGALFAVVFMIAERRNKLEQLAMKRVALWGFIGGAALPAILVLFGLSFGREISSGDVLFLVLSGALGSIAATGTLALATRKPVDVQSPNATQTS